MNFVRSNFAKKLIIILISIILLNTVLPHQVNAIDTEGILIKPITGALLSVLIAADVTLSSILNGISITADRYRNNS